MSSPSIKERELELNELFIYPIKGIAKHILYVAEYIANGKILKENLLMQVLIINK